MTLSDLRNQLKTTSQIRAILDALYDSLTDAQQRLKVMDLKVMDLDEMKSMVQSALECVIDQTEDLNDADTKIHCQMNETMKTEATTH